jgi:ABC-type uncharacterized transport system YnjBCD ATPase subunit
MTMTRLKPADWRFDPDPLLAPGNYAIVCDDEEISQLLIDELARRIYAGGSGALGVLQAKPVFISNLRVWENIVLPTWYHSGHSLTLLDQRLQVALQSCEYSAEQLSHNLTLLPAQMDLANRRLAALLRAVLQEPKFLLLEHEWLTWLEQSRTRKSLLSQVYDGYTGLEYVLLITDTIAPDGYTPVVLTIENETAA